MNVVQGAPPAEKAKIIAHESRNQLSAIELANQLLATDLAQESQDQSRFCEIINRSIRRIEIC